jgi:hypothetical protein
MRFWNTVFFEETAVAKRCEKVRGPSTTGEKANGIGIQTEITSYFGVLN